MTPKEQAQDLYNKFINVEISISIDGGYTFPRTHYNDAINYALIAVNQIILSNPHGNPLNSDGLSTIKYWREIEKELLKL